MTDKELLELAAKAAGITFFKYIDNVTDYDSDHYGGPAIQIGHSAETWNPLTDDGDALRLAVKLGLWIYMSGNHTDVMTDVAKPIEIFMTEPYGDDPYAATRRAIVRAAAEIGRSMG